MSDDTDQTTDQAPETETRERWQRGRERLIEALKTLTPEEAQRLLGSEQAREEALAMFELGELFSDHAKQDELNEDEQDKLDISPLQSMADALAEHDLELENATATLPPFIGVPSASTMTAFVDALLSGDEALSLKVVQRHCDASFSAALKIRERQERPLEPGESARARGEVAVTKARLSVVFGALYYARFYAAVAQSLASAVVHVADEAAEGNTRAQA